MSVGDGKWLFVPTEDADRPWTGRIWDEGELISRCRFELIRNAEPDTLYDTAPFREAMPVIGLMDHQRPCTLVRPLITRVDPGKAGLLYPFLRLRIEGSCHAILTGIAVEDDSAAIFQGIGFESDAFAAWYGGTSISTQLGEDSRAKMIEASEAHSENIIVQGLGEISVARQAFVKDDYRSSQMRTRTIFRVYFETLRSLSETIDLCVALELLFGFLAGFRPKPPIFHIWKPADPDGLAMTNREGELDIGGINFTNREFPHPLERVHICGRGGTGLQQVLDRFIPAMPDFVRRIHAIEASRYFSTTLDEKFAKTMPIFEQFLKTLPKTPEEENYLSVESAFFGWVEAEGGEDFGNFSKKHLTVVDRKSPSLRTLIGRSIADLSSVGFRFDAPLAKRIAIRRAAMFHSSPVYDEDDIPHFYEETRAVTALLLFHTLRDLGVDLAPLTQQYYPFSDFSDFLKRGPWERDDG